jgi:glycine cleavage system aminomethyltransferase T
MTDILTDYREWRASLEDRIGTHSPGCHMWPRHERCMIHRLAAALAAEQAKRKPEAQATPGEGTRQDGCIVARLRQTRADMIGTDDEQHYWDCHEAANEIERLRLAIRRLAEQDATLSVQGGNVTVTMDATLADAEREAVRHFGEARHAFACPYAATLRGLLERTTHPERD